MPVTRFRMQRLDEAPDRTRRENEIKRSSSHQRFSLPSEFTQLAHPQPRRAMVASGCGPTRLPGGTNSSHSCTEPWRDTRMSAVKYDLIVIGSGPSGQRAAVAASKMKKRVAVVEARSVVGGVCINTGTIPSKTMREAVMHLSGYNYRSLYGMNYRVKEKISMADLAFRVQAVIKTEVDVTEAQLSRNGIDVVHGVARFTDPHQIRIEGPGSDAVLEADRIILAVGTKPATSD